MGLKEQNENMDWRSVRKLTGDDVANLDTCKGIIKGLR